MKRLQMKLGASLAATSMALAAAAAMMVASAAPVSASPASSHSAHPRVEHMGKIHTMSIRHAKKRAGVGLATSSNNLYYHGGVGGSGVETGPNLVYLVYWGSQWNGNDPSGEAAIQQSFFSDVGGSAWNNTVTQYCQGVAYGTQTCGPYDTYATNPSNVLAGVWYDNAAPAPSSPTQSDLANEAINAAAYFGNTTPASNTSVQYIINTSTGNSMSGFGTQWCAWHDYASSSYGNIAYTNFPYITDAGASCGANFVNSDPSGYTDGITIVGGHEFAETETDIYPSGGWLDSSGAENGDKCAWISSGQGASADVAIGANVYPVQSLWSNAIAGCAMSY